MHLAADRRDPPGGIGDLGQLLADRALRAGLPSGRALLGPAMARHDLLVPGMGMDEDPAAGIDQRGPQPPVPTSKGK